MDSYLRISGRVENLDSAGSPSLDSRAGEQITRSAIDQFSLCSFAYSPARLTENPVVRNCYVYQKLLSHISSYGDV